MALGGVAKGRDDRGDYILPVLHLYGQYRQTHAELNPDRLGSSREVLEQQEHLLLESWQFGLSDLCRQVVGDLSGGS